MLTVILGDFNEWFPRSRCSRMLTACFGRKLHRPTYPSLFPILSLDRIWVLPENVKTAVQVHSSPLAAEFVVVEEAAEEDGAWASGADPESFGGQVFSGVGSVL
jgi:hypothetical protein